MDPAILSATAALVGSLVGGVSTFAAYWLTQRVQIRAQGLMKRHAERETLYAEFIVEASKRFADAWSHHAESPEVVAGLFSAVERMRLTSSDAVIVAAEQVMLNILEAYAQPDKSFDDLRRSIHGDQFRDQFPNKLRDFSEACKNELRALTSETTGKHAPAYRSYSSFNGNRGPSITLSTLRTAQRRGRREPPCPSCVCSLPGL